MRRIKLKTFKKFISCFTSLTYILVFSQTGFAESLRQEVRKPAVVSQPSIPVSRVVAQVPVSSAPALSATDLLNAPEVIQPVIKAEVPVSPSIPLPASSSTARLQFSPSAQVKITQYAPVAQGLKLTIQATGDVTSFDVYYADTVMGPWKLAETISSAPSSTSKTFQWIDDGSKTGISPKQVSQRFYQVKLKTVDDPKVPAISNLSIPEQGLTLDVPYYVLTYQVTVNGATQQKTAEYNLKAGVNEIVVREVGPTGKETLVKRTITYKTAEDNLTEAQKTFRQTVLADNAKYFVEGVGIDRTTGFPYDLLGSNASGGVGRWTQPTAIGFYLQILSDIITRKISVSTMTPAQALAAANKTLTNLLDAQTRLGWNGLIPWLKLNPLVIDRNQVVFLDNMNLSQSIAAFLGSLEKSNLQNGTGKDIYKMGSDFLAKQQAKIKVGDKEWNNVYQYFYDSKPLIQQLYAAYDTAKKKFVTDDFGNALHVDRLGNEVRSGVAFAVTYFGVPQAAWTNLEMVLRTYRTHDQKNWTTIAPYDGGAFQVFWNMLRAPENEIPKMYTVLWNAFVAYTDYMQTQKLPGFPSASAVPGGLYDGKIGLQAIAETLDTLRGNIGSLYALGAAYLLDPAKVLSLIESVAKSLPALSGPNGFYDAASKAGVISPNYYAVDQGSLILGLSGSGPSSMKAFLQNRNLLNTFNALYQELPINFQQAPKVIPEPPVVIDPKTTAVVENFDGKSLVQSLTGTDNVYQFKNVSGQGVDGSQALQVDYAKNGFPYAYIKIQTEPGIINFGNYKSFRFKVKKLTAGSMSFIVKFESPAGAVEKTFTISSSTTGWQEISYVLPVGSGAVSQATSVLLFVDPNKTATKGSFLIDDIIFVP